MTTLKSAWLFPCLQRTLLLLATVDTTPTSLQPAMSQSHQPIFIQHGLGLDEPTPREWIRDGKAVIFTVHLVSEKSRLPSRYISSLRIGNKTEVGQRSATKLC
ncbi:hypothetical protein BD324DRAFT_668903 [Kockovaella imperatae]|uniref:Uncharacterized protein n=1 Tax=Kockovaella imperatae TaxID=4999 RepID=A0A1Y1U5L3_9TREE|nr:hypothetical protein BD324DRAFT_668903 [Kockovaella imperatae]ORX33320.1 hypothetical protein BD324DRAFT_668903 [Kockovaella imperatae]